MHHSCDMEIVPPVKGKGGRFLRLIKTNLLAISTLIAVAAAIVGGLLIRHWSTETWSERSLMYLEFPGEIFLRMLKMLILPLMISSLIGALGELDATNSGRIGRRAVTYYLTTTFMAVVLGIALVCIIHPGRESHKSKGKAPDIRNVTTADTMLDLIRNIVPENLAQATLAQYMTALKPPEDENITDLYQFKIEKEYGGGTNILGIVSYSIALGIIVGYMGPKGRPLLDFFQSLSEATMILTTLIIKLTPVGVFFLVIPRVVSVDDLQELIEGVGLYTLTVLLGLFLQGAVVLPLIYFIVIRKNPFTFQSHILEALMTAFGTSSSSATMPVTFNCLINKAKLDERIVRFCIPIGATINMDGTALYEAVAAIFIAQSRGINLSFINVVMVSITATAASIGAAGIPQAGLVTMVIVLNAVGLPSEDVALIYVIDWLLDRFRTAINVLGDSYGSAVVDHLSKDEIQLLDQKTHRRSLDQDSHSGAKDYGLIAGSTDRSSFRNSNHRRSSSQRRAQLAFDNHKANNIVDETSLTTINNKDMNESDSQYPVLNSHPNHSNPTTNHNRSDPC